MKKILFSANSSVVTRGYENSNAEEWLNSITTQLPSSMAVKQRSCEAALGRGSALLLDSSAVPCASLYCSLPVLVRSKMPQLQPRISSHHSGGGGVGVGGGECTF